MPFFSVEARDRVDSPGALDVGAEHRAARGGVRDRGVVGRELLRYEAGRGGPGISDRDQTPVGGRPDRIRPDARRPRSRWIGPRRCRRGTCSLPWGSQWWRSSATSTAGTKRRSPAGEIRRPERNLPLGMIGGTALIGVLYLLVNLVYFRAMPLAEVGASARIGEEATTALLGPTAGRLLAAAVSGVGLRLPFVGDHRRVAAWASDVAGRAGLSMAGPDSSSVPDPHGRDRDPRRLVDAAGPVGELRAAVPVLALLELHLPRDYGAWRCSRLRRQTAGHPDGPTASSATPGCRPCSWWR